LNRKKPPTDEPQDRQTMTTALETPSLDGKERQLANLSELAAAEVWIRDKAQWKSIGWNEAHTDNLHKYLNHLRSEAGFPSHPWIKPGPVFDSFYRSRQYRIRGKCEALRKAWDQAGRPGWDQAYDREHYRILYRDNKAEIDAREKAARARQRLFKC
jgi:hypothetical protein